MLFDQTYSILHNSCIFYDTCYGINILNDKSLHYYLPVGAIGLGKGFVQILCTTIYLTIILFVNEIKFSSAEQ